MNALDIQSVTKIFRGKRGQRVTALTDLTLSVQSGEVFGFLGPNGAGKSTTIKCLMGLIKATSGSATILGEPIGSAASRRLVGYLPENPAFFDYLTAEEYLIFVGKVFSMTDGVLANRINDVLKMLELWDARKRQMRSYSKGMVQRVGLAQTLLHDPDVFILDEPMSGLDPLGRALVKDIILELKQRGKTVFFSTHIIDDVEKVCDRVGVIQDGTLKAVEKVDDIIRTGVNGYTVHTINNRSGETGHRFVKPTELAEILSALNQNGFEVRLVEPQHMTLEEFFLGIVKEAR
jgi:ABC-2 type transport system ATP-binding protein